MISLRRPLDLLLELPPPVRPVVRVASAGISSAVLYAGMSSEIRFRNIDEDRRESWIRAWARVVCTSLRVDIVRAPGPKPAEQAPKVARVVVANHRSMIDIPVFLDMFGGHMLARGDMAGWPGMGTLATIAGTVYVDRSDPVSGAGAVQRMRELLRGGRTLGVFPEGTTFDGDVVRPFHAGAFITAARERCQVVPAGLAYEDPGAFFGDESFGTHARRLLAMKRIRVAVAVGTPIDPSGLRLKALTERAHDEVQTLVHAARAMLSR